MMPFFTKLNPNNCEEMRDDYINANFDDTS